MTASFFLLPFGEKVLKADEGVALHCGRISSSLRSLPLTLTLSPPGRGEFFGAAL